MTLSFACSKNASLAFTELGTPCSRPSVDSSRARLNLRKIVPATTATYSGKSPQTLVTALGGKCSTYPAACATLAVLCSTYAARAVAQDAHVERRAVVLAARRRGGHRARVATPAAVAM